MVMKCHYEVLSLPRDADEDAIKKSYRKLALKWHPDKNLDNIEEATLEFRVVQQAYDVLSDPQERAWYDKHREAILMGGMGKGDEYEDKSVDIYAFFNSSCYSGFHDDEGGFYAVYRTVFEQIAEEDYAFMDDDDSDNELPNFGDSLSGYDDMVGPFYGYWEAYCTAKSYVWCEKWDTRDAPDRMTRRAMEQENRKLCEAKRKERNEEVRALVAFVKKRDRRVIAHKKYLAEKAERSAQLAKEKRLNDRKAQLKKMEDYSEADWSSMSCHEDQLRALENELAQEFRDPNSDSSGSEEIEDNLFCIVCNKAFKTNRALINHEKSKKHKENVALLRKEMMADDEEFIVDFSDDQQEVETPSETPQKLSKKQKKKRKQQQQSATQSDLSTCESVKTVDEADSNITSTTTQDKEAGNLNDRLEGLSLGTETEDRLNPIPYQNGEEAAEADEDDSFVHKSANKAKKKNKKKGGTTPVNILVADSEPGSALTCKICKATMTSRNKLFEHIKETGHAALKAPPSQHTDSISGEGKSKRKGKRK